MSEIINFKTVKNKRKSLKKNDAVFDRIFVDSLKELKEKNLNIFLLTSTELFQRLLALEEIIELEKHELIALYYRFKENIQLHKSIIDINKLAQIIQICKAGYNNCNGHNFGCNKCNGNCSDLDPETCSGCARKMARYIAINYKTIIKDDINL